MLYYKISIWYTLSITPTGGSPVNYYFKTVTGQGNQPITGMYLTPYTGNNRLYPEPGTTPSFNSGTGAISALGFTSSELQNAYSIANPSQDSTTSLFVLSGNPSGYTIVASGEQMSQTVLVGVTTSTWYTLQVAVNNGTPPTSPVNYFFSTVTGDGVQPITGLYETPYNSSNNLLIPDPSSPSDAPTYNASNSRFTDMFFQSEKLKAAFAAASPPRANVALTDYFLITYSPVDRGNRVDAYSASNIILYGQFGISSAGPVQDPSCFNKGTKILCLNKELMDEYIKIEYLRKGDFVKCYNRGYRRIDLIGKGTMINNRDNWKSCMYKMLKTEENGLIEDLIVTGGHSILVDELGEYKEANKNAFGGIPMIEDKYLLLSSITNQFIKVEDSEEYTYYHFVVENDGDDSKNYGVWANGLLTESMCKEYFKSQEWSLIE